MTNHFRRFHHQLLTARRRGVEWSRNSARQSGSGPFVSSFISRAEVNSSHAAPGGAGIERCTGVSGAANAVGLYSGSVGIRGDVALPLESSSRNFEPTAAVETDIAASVED